VLENVNLDKKLAREEYKRIEPAFQERLNHLEKACWDQGIPSVIVFEGWFHGQSDPNGTLVMRFTIHGTLNGTPVDLTASSPPIREID